MSKSHVLLRYFRLLHLYLGVFVAPALLFFAFTGALQTFSLHETTPGSSYQPPKWAMVLAQIHKKATPILPAKKLAPGGHSPAAASGHGPGPADHSPAGSTQGARNEPAVAPAGPSEALAHAHHTLPLKIFFLLVSLGLFTLTLTGLYMSWKFTNRRHGLLAGIFLAGVVVPVALVFL